MSATWHPKKFTFLVRIKIDVTATRNGASVRWGTLHGTYFSACFMAKLGSICNYNGRALSRQDQSGLEEVSGVEPAIHAIFGTA